MTTNRDWLFSLPLEEQYAWMNADHVQQPVADASERVTNQAEMLHMPESPTSETMQHIGQVIENTVKSGVYGDTAAENADSRELLDADVRKWCGKYAYQADMVWTWLNRQAAISKKRVFEHYREELKRRDKRERELTAERDNLAADLERCEKERERYRDLFGKCIDYADAIHALMDDEGMA